MSQADIYPPGIPPAPRRTLAQRAPDLLIWGGVLAVLIVAFKPVDMNNLGLLITHSANMRDYLAGFLRPDFSKWREYAGLMWVTIQIALWGTALAVVIAIPFGLACSRNIAPIWLQLPMRLLMNLLRSVPDLVVATLFLVSVGLGPLPGVLAIAINTGGVLAKLFSEAVEAIDKAPLEGVRATGATRMQEIIWGVIPQVAPLWTSYGLYRLESNSRAATVLGLIGAGGIGGVLFELVQSFAYRQLAMAVIVILVAVTLIDLLSRAMRSRLL